MSEGASAPTAPAAAPATTPTNGASGSQAPTPQPKTGPSAGRATDGKFLPKQGEDVAKPAPAEAERPKGYKFKLKVDGREEEAEYASEADLVRELQLSRAAQARMREATQAKREHAALLERLKAGDEALFSEHGVDLDGIAAKRLAHQARQAMMTPEAREAAELKAKYEAQQKELETLKTTEKQRALAKYEQAMWSEMEPQFFEALEASGLPKDPAFMDEIARIGHEFLDSGLDVSPANVVAEVARRENTRVWDRVRAAEPGLIAKKLGPEIVKAIAESYTREFIEKRRAGQAAKLPSPVSSAQPTEGRVSKYIDADEFARSMKDLK